MMQRNTEERRDKKKWALISVLLIAGIIFFFIAALIQLFKGIEDLLADGIIIFYIVMGLAVVIGALICLKQRFNEIDSGEAEEAKKY